MTSSRTVVTSMWVLGVPHSQGAIRGGQGCVGSCVRSTWGLRGTEVSEGTKWSEGHTAEQGRRKLDP
jgi:hypothetical protein